MTNNLRFAQKVFVKFLQIAYCKTCFYVLYYRHREGGQSNVLVRQRQRKDKTQIGLNGEKNTAV